MENYLDKSYWSSLLKMGLSRFFILRVLYSGPLHCYAIAKRITQMTHGSCSPAEGALYPVLSEFMEGGYVTCTVKKVSGRQRKVYTLTKKGIQAYDAAMESWYDMTRVLVGSNDGYAIGEAKIGDII